MRKYKYLHIKLIHYMENLSKVYKIQGMMTIIVIKVKTLLASSLPFGTWLLLVAMRDAISCACANVLEVSFVANNDRKSE